MISENKTTFNNIWNDLGVVNEFTKIGTKNLLSFLPTNLDASDFSFDYNQEDDNFKVQGKLSVSPFYSNKINNKKSIDVDLSDDNYILIENGERKLKGSFVIDNIDFLSLWGFEAKLTWDEVNNRVDGDAKLTRAFGLIDPGGVDPIFISDQQGFGLRQGWWNKFKILHDNPIVGSYYIAPDTDSFLMSADWEIEQTNDVSIVVETPDGRLLSEDEFFDNKIQVVEEFTDSNTKTVIVVDPKPGIWDILVEDETGLGEVRYTATGDFKTPEIQITSLEKNTNSGEVTINYNAFDSDSEAQVKFFYDNDNQDFNGLLITDDVIESDGEGSFVWNTEGVAPGNYYVYAMILDENTAPAFDYSEQSIEITKETDLSVSQFTNFNPVATGEELVYTVTVTNNGAITANGITLDQTFSESASFKTSGIEPSKQKENTITFDLGNIVAGASKKIDITVTAPDTAGEITSQSFITSETFDSDITNDIAVIDTTVGDTSISSPPQIINFNQTATGFIAQFSQEIDRDLLNLYQGEKDVLFTDKDSKAVKGSLIWNEKNLTLTFIKTGTVLAVGNYNYSLLSNENSFVNRQGKVLEADYTGQFTIEQSDRIISIPDLTLAPGKTAAIPLTLDNAADITKVEFSFYYDPDLLNITAVNRNSNLPTSWQLTESEIDRDNGIINVTIEGTDALTGNNLNIVNLEAVVPDTASYGATQILDLENVVLNGGNISAIADDGIHQVMQAGDVTGDGIMNSLDTNKIMEVSVGLEEGFDRFATVDPVITADMNGDGVISAFDAYLVFNS